MLRLRSEIATAWLVRLDPGGDPGDNGLCAAHADRVELPSGWRLRDERGRGRLSLLSSRTLAAPALPRSAGATATPRRAEAPCDTPRTPASGERPAARAAAPRPDRPQTARPATRPELAADGLDTPDADRTPLLARAFRNVRRR